MQVQELVGLVPWTLVFQICNLLLQVFLIKKFLFKPVNAILEKRRLMADAQIRDAMQAKSEAEAMKAEYEGNLTASRLEAGKIIEDAQKYAAAQSERLMKDAAQQAASIKAKAENDIVQERKKAVNEIKDEIGSLAVEIAEKVIEREISEKDHERLIDEFIACIGEGV